MRTLQLKKSLNRASSFSWSSYWAARLDTWLKGRNGLAIPATIGNSATVLPVCGSSNGTNSYIKAPVGTKGLSFTDITMEAFFEFTSAPTGTVSRHIFGRNYTGNANGDIFIYAQSVSSKFYLAVQNFSTTYNIPSDIEIEANVLYHVILTQNAENGLTMYVNQVSKGTVSYNAIQASANEPFSAGAWVIGGTPSGFAALKLYTTRLYNVCLTPQELSKRWSLQDVTRGLILCWDFMGGVGSSVEHDRSGQSNHGTWVGTAPYYGYSANGCKDNLNNGYKRYFKAGSFPLCLPKLIGLSSYPASLSFPVGYSEWGEIGGSSVVHNLAASKLRLPAADVFDRSNVTTNNDQSRAAASYDSGNVTDWDIWEASNFNIITSYLNTGHQATMATKNTWAVGLDGIGRPISLDELLLCNENQSGDALTKLLKYTGNE